MTRRTKRTGQTLHAKRRFSERLGVEVSNKDLRAMVALIQAGRATKIEDQSLRVGVYQLCHEGQDITVVYDRHRKTIVTVLP